MLKLSRYTLVDKLQEPFCILIRMHGRYLGPNAVFHRLGRKSGALFHSVPRQNVYKCKEVNLLLWSP